MAVTNIGPDEEKCDITSREADAFVLIVEHNTRPPERLQLSNALRVVNGPKPENVVNAYHKNARQMWRSVPGMW